MHIVKTLEFHNQSNVMNNYGKLQKFLHFFKTLQIFQTTKYENIKILQDMLKNSKTHLNLYLNSRNSACWNFKITQNSRNLQEFENFKTTSSKIHDCPKFDKTCRFLRILQISKSKVSRTTKF